MADVRPFRALRYNPELDLAADRLPAVRHDPAATAGRAVRALTAQRRAYRAGKGQRRPRYENATRTLHEWLDDGILRRDSMPAYYLYEQTFPFGERSYTRRLLFARLRVVPWSEGAVLPHEQTFPKHKADRLELMRAAHINGSPVFLFYRDADKRVYDLIDEGEHQELPLAEFEGVDGQHHRLMRIDEPATIEELERAFADETLYVADGHHRYETALMYRDEVKSQRSEWTGDEPENFALVGLVAADDPGMLVLPTHRMTNGCLRPGEKCALASRSSSTSSAFEGTPADLVQATRQHGDEPAFGLANSEGTFVLTIKDGDAVDRLLPQDRSPAWRSLDYAICDYAIVRGIASACPKSRRKTRSIVWFTEDAAEALRQVRDGRATLRRDPQLGAGATRARSGGRRRAHAAEVHVLLPEGADGPRLQPARRLTPGQTSPSSQSMWHVRMPARPAYCVCRKGDEAMTNATEQLRGEFRQRLAAARGRAESSRRDGRDVPDKHAARGGRDTRGS